MAKAGPKRKRKARISVASQQASTKKQILASCGTCHDPLHEPPTIKGKGSTLKENVLITCANVKNGSCCAFTLGHSSPHFHLECLGIPNGSVLYKNILEAIEMKKKETKISPKSNTLSPITYNITVNDFLCPWCDVQGTSRYLSEYFVNFRKVKMDFHEDEEAVDEIGPLGPTDGNSSGSFIRHILSLSCKSSGRQLRLKQSELQLHHIQNILSRIEVDPNEPDLSRDQESDENSSPEPKKGSPDRSNNPKNIDIGPIDGKFLVGQTIRLFCDIDNTYHTGRIIDHRICQNGGQSRLKSSTYERFKQSDSKKLFDTNLSFDMEICRTQYLVRFRAGMEGRKVAVHHWLFLEEHPIQVSVALIWARAGPAIENREKITEPNGKKKKVPKYRPAQIFLRSSLEMAPVKEINMSGELDRKKIPTHFNIFTLFFGTCFDHAIFRISQKQRQPAEIISLLEEEQDRSSGKDSEDEATTIGKNLAPSFVVADFASPPKSLGAYLKEKECQDEALVFTTTFACMELEEQRRVRVWNGLPRSSLYYPILS